MSVIFYLHHCFLLLSSIFAVFINQMKACQSVSGSQYSLSLEKWFNAFSHGLILILAIIKVFINIMDDSIG